MNLVRQSLQQIVTQYGHPAYHDPKVCKSLLWDFCRHSQYCNEISILVGALEEGIPAQILASSNTIPYAVLIAQSIKKLQDNRGLTEEAATWAVESWVLALGVSSSSAPQQQDEEDRLQSHRGIDYTHLRDLLVANKWKEADLETHKLMLKAAHREKQGWFDSDSIKRFPCEDLQIIDKLWLKYSNGRFGFSVQKNIYQRLKPVEDKAKMWDEFAAKVNWKTNQEWLEYDKLSFNINYSGHLPAFCYIERLYVVSWRNRVATYLWLGWDCFVLFRFCSNWSANWTELVRWWQSASRIKKKIVSTVMVGGMFFLGPLFYGSLTAYCIQTFYSGLNESNILHIFFKKIYRCDI